LEIHPKNVDKMMKKESWIPGRFSFGMLVCWLVLLIPSCSDKTERKTWDEQGIAEKAEEYANAAQSRLLGALLSQIEQEGVIAALGYCHEKAASLTTQDSLEKRGIAVSRVAQRNRNVDNALNPKEVEVYGKMKAKAKLMEGEEQILLEEAEAFVWYKAIFLGMPTCLQCHGKKLEMAEEVTLAIDNFYPEDKAKEFSLGDLRGMWKVKIPKTELSAFQIASK
jgi:hypothetical protein